MANPQAKTHDSPADAADDADAGGGDQDGADKAGEGDEAEADAAAAAAGYRPDGLPDHLYGKDDKETIDRLHGVVAGIRKDLAKKGVPETPDKYDIKLPDDIAAKVLKPGKDGKDPILETFKPLFHKRGISNEAATEMVTELYKAVAAIGGDRGPDGTGEEAGDFDFKALGGPEKAKPMQDASNAWINGMETGKKLSKQAADELRFLTVHSDGLAALKEIRLLLGEKDIPADLSAGGNNAPPSLAEAEARMLDDRYWKPGVKDDAFIEETRKMVRAAKAAQNGKK